MGEAFEIANLITVTTDFGASSPYVAAMKGVILSLNPTVGIIDISHTIAPQSVRQGAIVLADVTPYFPAGTLHIAVVDPGVGTDRALVYAEIGRQRYLAPDNGLLSLLARQHTVHRLVRLEDSRYWLPRISRTFHGRDILAPVAAFLAKGLNPELLGPPHPELTSLNWPAPELHQKQIRGELIAWDDFGNLITNITQSVLQDAAGPDPTRASLKVQLGNCEIAGLVRTYGERNPGEVVALINSSDRLEIAVVQGNAKDTLRAQIGAPVTVTISK